MGWGDDPPVGEVEKPGKKGSRKLTALEKAKLNAPGNLVHQAKRKGSRSSSGLPLNLQKVAKQALEKAKKAREKAQQERKYWLTGATLWKRMV